MGNNRRIDKRITEIKSRYNKEWNYRLIYLSSLLDGEKKQERKYSFLLLY